MKCIQLIFIFVAAKKKTKAKSKITRPIGRPSKYKPDYCDKLLEVMKKGYSFEAVAGHLEIDKSTLYYWADKYPEFSYAKTKGLELSRIFWEKLGLDHAVTYGGKESVSLNTGVWIFNMKNRFAKEWRDKQDVEHSGKVSIEDLVEQSIDEDEK